MLVDERFSYHLQVIWGREPHGAGWRRFVGRWLRKAADRLDGRRSLAVALAIDPPIANAALHECFKQGAQAIDRAIEDECRTEARERVMRRVAPQLYRS